MTYGAPAAPGDLTQPQGSTAVFVDASGRRWRRVRWLGLVLAGLLVTYLVLLAAALVGPPALSRIAVPGLGPVLPGPAAAPLGDGRGGSATPREALVQPDPARTGGATPGPARTGGTPGTTAPPTGAPAPAAPAPAAPAAPAPAARPSPAPTPAATPPPAAGSTGQPTARPTPAREPGPAASTGRPSEQPSPAGGRPTEPPGQVDREPGTSDRP